MDNLNELDYDPDETQKSWHWYSEDGEPLMIVNITYKNGHTDSNLEKLIKLHAKGFRIKSIS
jgi:hypothetical protein